MMFISALLLAAPLALAQPAPRDCDVMRSGSRTSSTGTHIDSDDDGRSPVISFTKSDATSCRSATIVGRLRYSENEDDIIEMPFGGYATFRERTAGDDRELTISRSADGGIVRLYRRNGANAPFDADAKRWLSVVMPAVLMDAGINVAPRVARWRTQGGTDLVLARIGTMSSSGAKRSHYEELMTSTQLSDADLDKVIRHAGRNLPSSGDLRAVLIKAAPTRGGVRSGSALEEAITNVASSGDKTSVLSIYGQTSDRNMLLSVMRMAKTIASSGDKGGLLERLAPRYLKNNDHELHTSFFETAETIPSSGDLSNVLKQAVPYAASSAEQALLLIDVARRVPSSGDRSSVLIALVASGAVKPGVVRDAFMEAANTVPSSGDRSRVLQAVLRS